MKKFIVVVSILVALYIAVDYMYYHLGWYLDFGSKAAVETFMKTEKNRIYKLSDSGYEEFEIKGVNLGSGEPGEWSTDFHINKETYKRWFAQMQEMGANRCV